MGASRVAIHCSLLQTLAIMVTIEYEYHNIFDATSSFFSIGGAAVMTSLVKNLNIHYATTLVAAVICTYTFIGGLGATFYVSYFNTAIIYIIMIVFIMKVYNDPNNKDNPLGKWSLPTRR